LKGELLGLGRRGVRGRRRGGGRLRLRVEVAVGLGLVVVVRGREMLEGRFDPDVVVGKRKRMFLILSALLEERVGERGTGGG